MVLDGLAAGSALFSTLVVFVVAIFSGSSLVSLLTIALAGAILGFLRFNFNPATIFLGDCGSLFVGFMLSALALAGAQKAPTAIAVAIPVVSFGCRFLRPLSPCCGASSAADRYLRPIVSTSIHKLLQSGMSPRQVVIVLYAVSGLFALLSLFLLWPTGNTLDWFWRYLAQVYGSGCNAWDISNLASLGALLNGRWNREKYLSIIFQFVGPPKS